MMILFLVLMFLRTLLGAPLSTPAHTTLDTNTFLIRDVSTGGTSAKNLRSTYDILQSCVLTIFACVWSSGHPNIAGPRDAGWTCFKRRVVTMSYALLAPEVVAYWALRQYFAAKKIARDYNQNFVELEVHARDSTGQPKGFWHLLKEWFMALWDGLQDFFKAALDGMKEWFTILPKAVTRRGEGQAWTQTHGFFIQMGGFLLYENEYPTRVLTYSDLAALIRDKKVEAPTATERELQDRSKGDGISKGFVVLQTTWFVIQCITRLCQHLPLSELEVVTLSFAVLNAIIYAVWWNRPQGVGGAIWIPLKVKKDVDTEGSGWRVGIDRTVVESRDAEVSAGEGSTAQPGIAGWQGTHSPPVINIPAEYIETAQLIVSQTTAREEENPPAEKGWLRRQLEKDSSNFSWLEFAVIAMPFRCLGFLLRPLRKMTHNQIVLSSSLRVPMFFADDGEDDEVAVNIVVSIIGTVFGAVHLLGWSSDFPSQIQYDLWNISTFVITAEPVLMLMWSLLYNYVEHDGSAGDHLFCLLYLVFLLVAPFYIIARLALTTMAFLSLRSLPPQIFFQVSWTSFIPHL